MNAHLWISNVAPEASDDELVALVKKYCNRESEVVLRAEGDGTRPARMLEVSDLAFGDVEVMVRRINGLYWKNRMLLAYHPQHTGPEHLRSSPVTAQSPDGHDVPRKSR
jgi:hypothetical protein